MFTSIYIKGFKSFYHSLCLPVDSQINIFIGPNGCGKSNIFDAFLWVLGEQSTRKLRGDNQRDLIFSGTFLRKPLGMAEVALEFHATDNESKTELPMTIARRIFRNDESIYMLNNQPARLHVIQAKLRYLGMTLSPYSFITQGNVESLLSKKPQELQHLFEEIADIHKYKKIVSDYMQNLTEKTLEFNIIKQKKKHIQEQLQVLKQEADHAMRYNELLQQKNIQLKESYILEFRLSFEKLNQKLMKKVELQKNLAQLTSDWQSLNTLDEDHYRTMNRINADLDIWSKAFDGNAQRKRDFTNQSYLLQERISLNQKESQRLEKEILAKKKRYAALEIGFKKSIQSLQEAETQVKQKQAVADKLSGIIKQKKKEYDNVIEAETSEKATAEKLNRQAIELGRSLEQANRVVWQEHSQQQRDKKQISALEVEKTSNSREYHDLQQKQKKAEQHLKHYRNLADKEIRLIGIREGEQKTILKQVEENQHILISVQTRKALLENLYQKSKNQEIEALMAQNDKPVGYVGQFHEVFKVSDEQMTLVDAFLGPLNRALVFQNDIALSDFIAQCNHARVQSSFALVSLQRLEKKGALELTGRDRPYYLDLKAAHGLAVNEILSRPGSINAYLSNRDGIFFIFSPKTWHRERLFAWFNELKQLKEKQENLQKKAADLKTELAFCAKELGKNRCSAKKLNTSHQETKRELYAYEQLLCRLENELSKTDKKQQELRQAMAQAAKQQDVHTRAMEELQNQAAGKQNELSLRQTTVQRLSEQLKALKDKLEALQLEYRELCFQLQDGRKNCSLYKDSIQEYKNNRYETELVIEDLLRNLGKREDLVATLVQQSEFLDQEMLTLQTHLKEAREKRNQILKARDIHLENLQGIKSRASEIQKQRESCQNTFHNLELDIERFKTRQDMTKQAFLKAGFQENELYYYDLAIKMNDSALNGYKHSLALIEKNLAQSGPINSLAIESYARESRRYADYLAQSKDILDSIHKLNDIINRTNKKAVEQYVNTVRQVEDHFKTIYKRFFDGGTAKIKLQWQSNKEGLIGLPLPEIVIRPPGKRVSKISLMSGGEKALSSIALLFAFFLFKPSPFCFLDEVDAALDDVNTERFIDLLKEFAHKTQFFIISHNRKTMACGQNIYGVTAQEKGIF